MTDPRADPRYRPTPFTTGPDTHLPSEILDAVAPRRGAIPPRPSLALGKPVPGKVARSAEVNAGLICTFAIAMFVLRLGLWTIAAEAKGSPASWRTFCSTSAALMVRSGGPVITRRRLNRAPTN
jgi:hypothetical protein